LRPDYAAIPLSENKKTKKDVMRELNTVNFYLSRFLPSPKSGACLPDDNTVLVYKTHIKISCHPVRKSASYISVLSIIPPQ
jgi:hypothetical protein